MKAKIEVEKLTEENPLTIEEQQKLLEDLLMLEALLIGYEKYCKKIGKFKEAMVFLTDFMKDLNNDDIRKHFETKNDKGGEA